MSRSIAVLVVEREPLFRRGLVSCLSSTPDIDVIATTTTAEDTIRVLGTTQPAVAIVGTIAPATTGLELAANLRRRAPELSTIVISRDETDDELFAAVRAGASAYCGRDIEEASLHDLVRRSADGEYVINEQLLNKPYLASRVLDQFRITGSSNPTEASDRPSLTRREMDVLRRISSGLTNTEIAFALGISTQTVKNHITSILRKLDAHDRTQAVMTALRNGWLAIDDAEAGTPSDIEEERARGSNPVDTDSDPESPRSGSDPEH